MSRDSRHDSTSIVESTAAPPRPAPGRVTLTERLVGVATSPSTGPAIDHAALVQRRAAQDADLATAMGFFGDAAAGDDAARAIAAHGVGGAGGALPHVDAIQRSFGAHDVSGVRAHVGGAAASAADALGAEAYATGSSVAFRESPSLFVAAHEAAHVVQQRAGVHLRGALGQVGDVYERHADEVAARVVAGASAEDLLTAGADGAAATPVVQRKEKAPSQATAGEKAHEHDLAESTSTEAARSAIDLATIRIGNSATAIEKAMGAKGMDAQAAVGVARTEFAHVTSVLVEVAPMVQRQEKTSGASDLFHELGRLRGALDRFATTWTRAQKFAADNRNPLTENTNMFRLYLESMAGYIGRTLDQVESDPSADQRTNDEVRKAAVASGIEAARHAVRSVRMSMDGGKPELVEADLQRVNLHVHEIETALAEITDAKLRHGLAAGLKPLLDEVAALEHEATPAVARRLGALPIATRIAAIKASMK
jgi:Domain of unknown function (DUF4157)